MSVVRLARGLFLLRAAISDAERGLGRERPTLGVKTLQKALQRSLLGHPWRGESPAGRRGLIFCLHFQAASRQQPPIRCQHRDPLTLEISVVSHQCQPPRPAEFREYSVIEV